jgi:hypothetical protein
LYVVVILPDYVKDRKHYHFVAFHGEVHHVREAPYQSLKYAVGHDKVDQTYQTVGGFVNLGFRLENLLRGESPFTTPEPIFNSPRHTRYMLTQKVRRDWHQPAAVVVARSIARSAPTPGSTLTRLVFSGPIIPDLVPLQFSPPLPGNLTGITSVTVSWCGLQATTTGILFLLGDQALVAHNAIQINGLTLQQGNGSRTVPTTPFSSFVNPIFVNSFAWSGPALTFDSGGGLAVTLNL